MVMSTIAITVLAQVPQAFKYPEVARDNAWNILANPNVSFQTSILQGSASGTSVCTETHNTTTNEFRTPVIIQNAKLFLKSIYRINAN